jgi:hypothetical protein
LSEIRPRLRAFFSSRFVIVDAGQSPGASLVTAAGVSGATFFDAAVAALGPVALVAALTVAAAPFFLTILARFLKNFGDLGAAARCRNEGRRRGWQGQRGVKSLVPPYEGKVTEDLGRWIRAVEIGRRFGSPRVKITSMPKEHYLHYARKSRRCLG